MSSYFEPDDPRVLLAGRIYTSGTVSVQVVRPSLAAGISPVGGAGAYQYGAWLQLVAPNDLASHMMNGFLSLFAGGRSIHLQFGTGAAGVEVGIGEIVYWERSDVATRAPIFFPQPLQIPANSRVAVRLATNVGGDTLIELHGFFIPRPLA